MWQWIYHLAFLLKDIILTGLVCVGVCLETKSGCSHLFYYVHKVVLGFTTTHMVSARCRKLWLRIVTSQNARVCNQTEPPYLCRASGWAICHYFCSPASLSFAVALHKKLKRKFCSLLPIRF